MTYDAFGRIAETNAAGTYQQILYGPVGRIGEMKGQTTTSVYLPQPGAGTLYAWGTNATNKWFMHPNWLGTKTLGTTLAARGQAFDTAYAPYGEKYNSFGSSGGGAQDFTGDLVDITNGLFDTPNRELMQNSGRWLSPDPAHASWNAYSYPTNPNSMTDPSGLAAKMQFDNPNSNLKGEQTCAVTSDGMAISCENALNLLLDPSLIQIVWPDGSTSSVGGYHKQWIPGYTVTYGTADCSQGDLCPGVTIQEVRGHYDISLVGPGNETADTYPGLAAFYDSAACSTCGRTLRSAAGTMNDWRTYAGWYGASLLVGGGGAIIANVGTMHVAVGALEGNLHFAFESGGTWMHGLLVPATDEVVATEGLAESFAEGATQIPVPVLYPEAVLPEAGTSMTNCFTGMCSAIARGWGLSF
ncbi:MAG TPA: RHS repeat-associated core domain-containing protein [Candidatus Binatia bacterium]|nr:RHS repeat-associated core domain-containing protein [Candidatus Binatia bacterium]